MWTGHRVGCSAPVPDDVTDGLNARQTSIPVLPAATLTRTEEPDHAAHLDGEERRRQHCVRPRATSLGAFASSPCSSPEDSR
jgi:hypothetical protein